MFRMFRQVFALLKRKGPPVVAGGPEAVICESQPLIMMACA